ncbi:MAG TPA: acetyl-CoA hydrolase/transferase C-terminal domain-containing protein [Acidimicrobiales bacterium]|nr:acetyl-CoA hydrolase/transferase C-terminal domain-containing protein [Acidimicrobiales bacterium]
MTTLPAALDRIPTGGRIIAGACCGGPTSLLRGVAERSTGRGWLLWTGLLLDDGGVYDAARAGDLSLATWHVAGAGRQLLEDGLLDFAPVRASRLERCISAWDLDAALVRVSPPDANGWCSLGPSVAYARTAIEAAKLCIAEVDEALPRTHGASMVHVSDLDVLVPSTTETPRYRSARPDELSRAIARNVLTLLPDRPVLQLGIGTVTEALVSALLDERVDGLRFVGMGMDAMADLFEHGLLARTPPGAAAIESPDLLGTDRMMRFAHENPVVGVYPSTIAHAPQLLARHDRLVSVNSAVEVDLSGQVNSEVAGGRQLAGIGGSIDFVEAASQAAEGVRIIALPSTTRNGERSRIVPRLAADVTVTIPRGMVDFVVTEHGVAQLEGRTLGERAEALIDVAAPEHRTELVDAMRKVAPR